MELLTKTLFNKYDLTTEDKAVISFVYRLQLLTILYTSFIGVIGEHPVDQRYLLN
jgi:hypothetical protein